MSWVIHENSAFDVAISCIYMFLFVFFICISYLLFDLVRIPLDIYLVLQINALILHTMFICILSEPHTGEKLVYLYVFCICLYFVFVFVFCICILYLFVCKFGEYWVYHLAKHLANKCTYPSHNVHLHKVWTAHEY